jgi:DNA-directed RNA polymerase specialized sigma24 family protein
MEQLQKLELLDENGKPMDGRIVATLRRLVSRFRRQFPTIRDEVEVQELLERVGRGMARRERDSGRTLEKPSGYAWSALQRMAISKLRGTSIEFHRRRVDTHSGPELVSRLRTLDGTPEQIERNILLREFRAQLTPDEELVYANKLAGYSSEQIGRMRGSSAAAVDVVVTRLRQKLRAFVNENGKTG